MPEPKNPPQPMPPRGQQLNISIDENVGEGVYANLVLIAHTAAEFVMDFARVMPGLPKTKIQSRLIMAPPHLKGFAKALQENLERYEARFGEIKANQPQEEKKIGFYH